MKLCQKAALALCAVFLTPAAAFAGEHSAAADFIDPFLKPLGILTFCLVIATLLLGFNMRKNRKLFFRWHKYLAIAAVASAAIHGILVFMVDDFLQ